MTLGKSLELGVQVPHLDGRAPVSQGGRKREGMEGAEPGVQGRALGLPSAAQAV